MPITETSFEILTNMLLLAGGLVFAAMAIVAASVQAYSDRHPRDHEAKTLRH